MNINIPNATRTVAGYAARLTVDTMPSEVVAQAKVMLADTVALLLRASTRPNVNRALSAFPLGGGSCTIVGHGRGAAPDHAAFINGVGGHDTELDDSHTPSRTHPAAVVIPAALAAAEVSGTSTGADLLAAIVAGYDVTCRVSKAIGVQSQYDRGFHPSSVCGSIGAAVAAGRMLGLREEPMSYAIGLATSQSCGLTTFEDDSSHMLKSFQTGLGARNGMTSALLARMGYESSPDALAGRHNVLMAFGGNTANPALLTSGLGETFEIVGTSIKRHACCDQTHSALDALLALLETKEIEASEIEAIAVEIAHAAVPIVDGNPLWTHNIQYVMALAAHERSVGVHHFDEEWTTHAGIAALAQKVTVTGSDKLQARFPTKKGASVTVTAGGRTFSHEVEAPVGNPANRLTPRALEAKFTLQASSVLSPAEVERLWDEVNHIESAANLDTLFKLLAGPPRG